MAVFVDYGGTVFVDDGESDIIGSLRVSFEHEAILALHRLVYCEAEASIHLEVDCEGGHQEEKR